MPILHIRFLGGLTLIWGEAPLPSIQGATARSLFAYLALHHDRSHTRDLLAGTFWPDLTDAVARRRLSQALWRIRRAFSPHPILWAEGDTVQLDPDLALWTDVEEFTRRSLQCKSGEPGTLTDCELCVEHYQGDFLAGYYDDWVLVERERLRIAFLAVLERLVEGLKARGDYEEALTYARRLVEEDQLREEAHREVMRLCHLLGRGTEALQQFQSCRQVLVDELGIEPSPGTVALAGEITRQTDTFQAPHLPVASQASPLALLERPERLPLVGRQVERPELVRHLELAVSGTGGFVLVIGGAGVGKTRLMQEVARDAAWRGVQVAWGHGCELAAPPPYQPLVEVLHGADLGHLSVIWQRELGRLLPELEQGGAEPVPLLPALEPELARGRVLEALAHAFLALGQSSPHLVVLEDVHWMDPASFEALRVLLPRLPSSRLLMVGTLRPEELAGRPDVQQLLSSLEATRIPCRLELAPLTAAETEILIRRILARAHSMSGLSSWLYTQTAGNPFFITETLQALVEQHLLVRDEAGEWHVPWDETTGDYGDLPVPRSIAQSIEQRSSRLPPAARDLLSVAAIIGRQVDFDLWLAVGDCDEQAAVAAAEELARRGLLVEMADLLGYRFAHDTIRRVVYDGLSPVRRRLLHRRTAAALEALHPEQVESLARHYRLGENWPEAVHYAILAGEHAQAVYANQQALDHYHRADGWLAQGRVSWPAEEVTRQQAELAEKQGQIYGLVGEYEAAEQALTTARQIWAEQGDWRCLARVLNRSSFWRFMRGDYAGASMYAEMALDALPETNTPADLRAASLTHLGLSAWSEGRSDEALPPLEQALALYEEIGTDLHGLGRCLNSLGLVHLDLGDLDQADGCFAQSLVLRQQSGNRWGEAWCWHNQGRTALARDDLVAAREKLEAARIIFAQVEHAYGLEASDQVLAEVEQREVALHQAQRRAVRLPRAQAPTGRPLRDDEYVSVIWTLAAPEDEALPAGVDRRRQRLLRLLQEAADQSAAPTLDDLALALGVSQPTVKRDLAALRRAGYEVQTRGSRER